MNDRRISAFIILATCLGAYVAATGALVLNIIIVLAAVIGLVGRCRLAIRPVRRLIAMLAIAFVVSLQYRFFPILYGPVISSDALAFHVGQCCLILMLLHFFCINSVAFDAAYVALAAAALTCLCKTTGLLNLTWPIIILCAGVIGVIAFHLARCPARRLVKARLFSLRSVILALITTVALMHGFRFAATLTVVSEKSSKILPTRAANHLVAETSLLPANRIAFDPQAQRLNSPKSSARVDRNAIVMRIFADQCPEYLTGCIYETYQLGQWTTAAEPALLLPGVACESITAQAQENVFTTQADSCPPYRQLEIWLNHTAASVLFLPEDVAHVIVNAEMLLATPSGAFEVPALSTQSHYRVLTHTPSAPAVLSAAYRQACLTVPKTLRPTTAAVARTLNLSERPFERKASALTAYFTDNHRYSLDAEFAEDVDPIRHFLAEKTSGHCQLFAASAVFLLRTAGVPARYVTGFSGASYDSFNHCWVVRTGQAHAWVQAWNSEIGRWVTLEFTPVDKAKTATSPTSYRTLLDRAGFFLQRFRHVSFKDGPVAALSALTHDGIFAGISLWPLPILAATVILLITMRYRSHRTPRAAAGPSDPRILRLQRLLKTMDRRLRRRGFIRAPNETLHAFAARIAAADTFSDASAVARWYNNYAVSRYALTVAVPPTQALKKQMAHLAQRGN